MAYELVCRPDDAVAVRNCLAFSNGRIQCLFIETRNNAHADQTTELHAQMGKEVLAKLTADPAFLKFRRCLGQLESAESELAAKKVDEQTAALERELERLKNDLPANAAAKIQDAKREIEQLAKDAQDIRERIAMLTPMRDALRNQVEAIAKGLSTSAVNSKTIELNEREITVSAALSKAANVHIKALADCKTAKQLISRYHNSPDFARVFVDAALSQS